MLAAAPIGLAGARTVPSAVRLDPVEVRQRIALEILAQQVFCFVSMDALLIVQLASL